jgi:hypothetical protein
MFLEIGGNRVFALMFGSGPRTFVAHSGWIGNYEDWIATLSLLSEGWRVIDYDHPPAPRSGQYRFRHSRLPCAPVNRCVLAKKMLGW